jgi:hypothetical protein
MEALYTFLAVAGTLASAIGLVVLLNWSVWRRRHDK